LLCGTANGLWWKQPSYAYIWCTHGSYKKYADTLPTMIFVLGGLGPSSVICRGAACTLGATQHLTNYWSEKFKNLWNLCFLMMVYMVVPNVSSYQHYCLMSNYGVSVMCPHITVLVKPRKPYDKTLWATLQWMGPSCDLTTVWHNMSQDCNVTRRPHPLQGWSHSSLIIRLLGLHKEGLLPYIYICIYCMMSIYICTYMYMYIYTYCNI